MAADGAAARADAGLAPKGYGALVCTKADRTGGGAHRIAMSNLPIVSTSWRSPRRNREVMLSFNNTVGGPGARVNLVEDVETPGVRGDTEPFAPSGPTVLEDMPLVRPSSVSEEEWREFRNCEKANRKAELQLKKCKTCVSVSFALVGILVAGLVGTLLWGAIITIKDAQNAVKPRIASLMDSVDDAANSTTQALENLLGSTEDAGMLTELSVPQLLAVVNSTARTVYRLESLLNHPTIQLALGQNG